MRETPACFRLCDLRKKFNQIAKMTKSIASSIIVLCLFALATSNSFISTTNCLSETESFHDDVEDSKSLLGQMREPMFDAKSELVRYSRSLSAKSYRLVDEPVHAQQEVENHERTTNNEVDNNNQPIVQQTTSAVQQQPVHVAQLKEVRVHTIPLSDAVRYTNYVVVPSGSRSANLEDSSASASSSSSSKSSSSSSSTITKEETVVVPQAQTSTTIVQASSAPVLAPAPDCTPVLQRIIMMRPEESPLIIKIPGSAESSSSSHSSRLVSETTQVIAQPQPPVYNVVETTRRIVPVVHQTSARLISSPTVVSSAPQSKEEHYHSESRSVKESSDGLGGFSSSSSSSSSRTSKSSSSSSTTTTTVHEATPVVHSATLIAAPTPVITKTITTHVREPAPIVTVKAAPLIAFTQPNNGGQTNTQVNVDHHFTSPNVNYGYSIKQSSVEPQQTKGVVVGERVVYLKR